MDKPISRKRALSLYREALVRGDFDTVAAVLWLAERDPELVRMISKFHEGYDALAADPKPRRGIIEFVRINREASPDGWPLKPDQSEEEMDMFTTFAPERSPYYSGARKLKWDPITLAVAVLVVTLLGIALLFMRAPFNPGAGGQFEETIPEFAAQPQPCVSTGQDPQAESARLAGEASTLMEAEGDNTELAMLLSICALQTAYTPEADVALQQAFSLAGALQQFEGHTWYMWGLVFSSDGQTLFTGGADSTLRVWNTQSREQLRMFRPGGVAGLSLSPDQRYLLIIPGPSGRATLRNVETGDVLRTFGGASRLLGSQFSQDGTYVLTSGSDGQVTLWDLSTGAELRTFDDAEYGSLSPDGRYIALLDCLCPDQTVSLYDLENDLAVRTFEPGVPIVPSIAFSHDGRYLLTGEDAFQSLSANNYLVQRPTVVQLWDVETGTKVRDFEGHTGQNSGVMFSPDDQYVLSNSYDGTARVWDVETGEQVRIFAPELLTVNQGEATVANFSPDGRQLVIGYETGMVVMWPTDYQDMIGLACEHVTRDFTAEERMQYGLGVGPACS